MALARRGEAILALRSLLQEQQSLPETELGRAAANMIPLIAERLRSAVNGVDDDPNPIENDDLEQEDLLIPERDEPELAIEPPPDLDV